MAMPMRWIILDVIGTVLVCLGLAERFMSLSEVPNFVAFVDTELFLIGVGVILMVPALIHLIMRLFRKTTVTSEAKFNGTANNSVLPPKVTRRDSPNFVVSIISQLKRAMTNYLLFAAVIAMFFLYLFFPITPNVPSLEQLNVSSGQLNLDAIGGGKSTRYPIIVDGHRFYCRMGTVLGGGGDCFDKQTRQSLNGKVGRVHWYDQTLRFGLSVPIAMQVEVTDVVVIEYEKQKQLLQPVVSEMLIAFGSAVFVFFLLILLHKLQQKYPKKGTLNNE